MPAMQDRIRDFELPLAWPFSALKMLLVRKFLNSMLSA